MKETDKRKFNLRGVLTSCVMLSLLGALLCLPRTSLEYMSDALKLCATRLIPSLFPFMIISDMLISGSVQIPLKSAITKFIGYMFGTSEDGSFAVLLGLLCGFPIGAKSALRLYGENRISHAELCHVMSFCNIPSPAFICGTVGALFGSARLGGIMFCSILLSAVIMGIFGRIFYKYTAISQKKTSPRTDAVQSFTSAIASSSVVMLNVCAYVVFFSVIIGYVRLICEGLGVPSIIPLCLSGMLEISSGMAAGAEAGTNISPYLAAFFGGFSGLSVFFQIISLDKSNSIIKKAFVLEKLFQGFLCSLIMLLALKIFPVSISPSAQTLGSITVERYGIYVSTLFFVASVVPVIIAKARDGK